MDFISQKIEEFERRICIKQDLNTDVVFKKVLEKDATVRPEVLVWLRSALEEAMTEGKKLKQADILELVEDLKDRGYEDRQIIQSVLNHIKFEELTNPNGADYTSDFGKD